MQLFTQEAPTTKIARKIFLFDSDVDCAAWSDYVFIFNVHQYHLMFQYFEALRRKSRKTLATVLQRVPIINKDEFEKACDSFPIMVKLASIAAQPYFGSLTLDALEKAIKRFKLDIEISTHKGERGLRFDSSPEKRWNILKLLDDGYLTSTMTRVDYRVNSKARLW